MAAQSLKEKVSVLLNNIRYYWKEPPKGRYMSFKEIASYSFGGIGAYLVISIANYCLISATNTFLTSTLGIGMTDLYILYAITVATGIPITAIRANIVDNTRNKDGKYRPYIVRMGIPSVIILCALVWFPYNKIEAVVGSGELFGKSKSYVVTCAIILFFNILLQFFYQFFRDSYEYLIYVLTPNSQERADVASIKSIVYSSGPTIVNLITPLVAYNIFHSNMTDIRVYKLLFPILGTAGILLSCIVYKNTSEKIIQAKTHVIQIKFIDAFKAVMKNKYFWIISIASWIGFLETAYSNIMYWVYNYGGANSGNTYSLVVTIYGNASFWGMLIAPFAIRKWGKKRVLLVTNFLNILFILSMLFSTGDITKYTLWTILCSLFMNALVGSFAHVLDPAIQADIRDYQQYKTGERIDGMFSAVLTIGTVIQLATSSVLPLIQEKLGMTAANAKKVTSNPEVLNRVLASADGKTVGDVLAEQMANGQNSYVNPSSALYDVDGVLLPMLKVLILVAAFGALLNVLPYFWYDFNERKQKSVVSVLKLRAMFEDYGNHALNNHQIVEAIDMVNNAQEMAVAAPKEVSKSIYQSVSDKAEKKAKKKEYKEALKFNDEIEIAKFVCAELNKFQSDLFLHEVEVYSAIREQGLNGIKEIDTAAVKAQLKAARALPKDNAEQKALRSFEIQLAKDKLSAKKYFDKYYGTVNAFVSPDMAALTELFEKEDALDEAIQSFVPQINLAKKAGDKAEAKRVREEISKLQAEKKAVQKQTKTMMDEFAKFNRAAKPFNDAEKLLTQKENYSHFDEIAALYDQAKLDAEEEDRLKKEEAEQKRLEEQAELERRKAMKNKKK